MASMFSKLGTAGLRSAAPTCRTQPRVVVVVDRNSVLCEVRVRHRGQLLVVSAKGKGKRSGQSTVLEEEPSFVEEEAPIAAPLTFVIEDVDDIPEEDEWAPKAKKGKGKGKKQKKKKANAWDDSGSESDDIAPAAFVVDDITPAAFVVEDIVVNEEEEAGAFRGRQAGKGKGGRKGSSWDEQQNNNSPLAFEPDVLSAPTATGFEQEVDLAVQNSNAFEETRAPPRTGRVQSAASEQGPQETPNLSQDASDSAFQREWSPRQPQTGGSEREWSPRQAQTGGSERYGTAESGGYGQPAAAGTARSREGSERRADRGDGYNSTQGWFDPEKRKAWNEKRARVFSRVTTQEIYAAATWQEVATILQARERILDHIHVTAALTVVSKVVDLSQLKEEEQEQFEQLLADIYRRIYSNVEKLGPRELATNLLSLARLGYTSDEVVQALLEASVLRLPDFNSIELCNAIYALGQMSVVPSPEWIDRYFQSSILKLRDFKPLELSNVIHALALLAQQPPAEWLEAFYAQSQAVLAGFTARDTATMLYGLGLLGAKPSEPWLKACVTSSVKGIKGSRVTDLKRGVWALSQFDFAPDYKWQNLFAGRAKSLLDYFSAEDLLTTTLAMAYLRFSLVDQDFVRRLVSKVQDRRGRYQPEELDNLNAALTALGHKGPAIVAPTRAPAANRVMAAA